MAAPSNESDDAAEVFAQSASPSTNHFQNDSEPTFVFVNRIPDAVDNGDQQPVIESPGTPQFEVEEDRDAN